MKKRIIALLIVGAAAIWAGLRLWQESRSLFGDMSKKDPVYPYAAEVVEEGLMSVRPDGSFDAEGTVSVEETMVLLLEAMGKPSAPLEEQAVEGKLVYRFEAEGLSEPCTRLQAAQMAARGLGLVNICGESPYADCEDGWVVRLYEQKLWVEEDTFRPQEDLQRGELARLLWSIRNVPWKDGLFRYNNYWVAPLEGVEEYRYDPDAFGWEEMRPTYAGEGYTLLYGVDVSGYQRSIDWQAVKEDGMDFAIVRVGGRFTRSGGLYDDSCFERNVKGALKAGLQVGVYFFSQAISAEEGVEEAEFVLERIAGHELSLPVIIDWEFLDGRNARTYGVDPKDITDGIAAFCETVKAAGYEPMLYFNSYCGYTRMDLRRLTDYDFWFAQYSPWPDCRYHFRMWQYSNTGTVAGISGNADLDVLMVPN